MIAEAIIGEVLSGEEGAPPAFELQVLVGDGNGEAESYDRRKLKVKKKKEFRLAIDYASHESSFRLTARILEAAKRRIGVSDLGLRSKAKASELLRIMRAVNFQKLADPANSSWAFFAAMMPPASLETVA